MDNRLALIPGASSGIGRACAAHLAARGIRVYGTSRNPPTFTMLQVDVTDDQSVQSAIAGVLQREGRLDIVVNNAGIAIAGPLELTSIEEAHRQFDVNLFGAFRVCRAVLPIMRRQGSGYIVNIGSIGGLRSEEHTSELQSHLNLVCRLLLEKKKKNNRYSDIEVRVHNAHS